jgi:hypothetical protein
VNISPDELRVLLHTLGLTDPYRAEPYRNHFVAGIGHDDLPHLDRLCDLGLMERRRGVGMRETDMLYVATEAGQQYAIEQHAKRKPSRAKRRYRAFLNLKDCCPDLGFREFLTNPQFAEYR